MSIAWKLFETLVNISEYAFAYFLYASAMGCRKNKRIPVFFIGVALSAVTTVLNMLKVDMAIVPLIVGAVFIAYSVFCFEGSVTLRIIYGFIPSLLNIASNYIVSTTVMIVTPAQATETLSPSVIRFEAMLLYVFVNLILFLITATALSKDKKRKLPLFQRCLMILLLFLGICAEAMIIRYSLLLSPKVPDIRFLAVVSFMLLLISFGITYLFYSTAAVYQKNSDMQLAVQQAEIEARYNKQVVDTYENLRQWRHDINNHLKVIKSLAISGDCKTIEKYSDEAAEGLASTMLTVNTKHPAIDAIISDKLFTAKGLGIIIKPSIVLPEKLSIANVEMCSILSNLFDNAIEAVSQIEDKQDRHIEFEIQTRGEMLSIMMANPSNGQYSFDGDVLKSTKKKNPSLHGLGIKRIKDIVERNNGVINITPENSRFTVNILLPLNTEENV